MREAQKLQAEMQRLQEEARTKTVEASSGGGMVTVVATGGGEVVS
ncbi:MAG TPA: YbaB/EbfC family nucleoid-associated protein, partial [Thermodesulfovibrionales bacterium]|nr:YbaB/EbfC family nucleoid-associated protein [Thermodesulfovibrionales bacterium]